MAEVRVSLHGRERIVERVAPYFLGDKARAEIWAIRAVRKAIEDKSFTRSEPKWASKFVGDGWVKQKSRSKGEKVRYVKAEDPKAMIIVGMPMTPNGPYRIITVVTRIDAES